MAGRRTPRLLSSCRHRLPNASGCGLWRRGGAMGRLGAAALIQPCGAAMVTGLLLKLCLVDSCLLLPHVLQMAG